MWCILKIAQIAWICVTNFMKNSITLFKLINLKFITLLNFCAKTLIFFELVLFLKFVLLICRTVFVVFYAVKISQLCADTLYKRDAECKFKAICTGFSTNLFLKKDLLVLAVTIRYKMLLMNMKSLREFLIKKSKLFN